MAEEAIDRAEDGARPSRNALWVSAGALLATLALIGLIFLIAWSNRARDEALGWERRTYDIMMRTRLIDTSIARSEAVIVGPDCADAVAVNPTNIATAAAMTRS